MVVLHSLRRGCQFEKLGTLASKLRPLPMRCIVNALPVHFHATPPSVSMASKPSFVFNVPWSTRIEFASWSKAFALASCCPHQSRTAHSNMKSNKLQSASDSTMKSANSNCWTCSQFTLMQTLVWTLTCQAKRCCEFRLNFCASPCLDRQNQRGCTLFILCIDVSIKSTIAVNLRVKILWQGRTNMENCMYYTYIYIYASPPSPRSTFEAVCNEFEHVYLKNLVLF